VNGAANVAIHKDLLAEIDEFYGSPWAAHVRRQDLFAAIDANDLEEVTQIVKAEPKLLFQTDKYGTTPLMHAVTEQRRKCVNALIEAGADVNAQTREGYTALHCVVVPYVYGDPSKGRATTKMVRILSEAGANLEIQQHYGWTPLMYAVIEGSYYDVQAFLSIGANPNKIFPQNAMPCFVRGRSLLSMSLFEPGKMELLVEAGADANLRDDYGQTTFEYAQQQIQDSESEEWKKKVSDCVELLRRAVNVKARRDPIRPLN
jgi:ankyrin repeat protein